MKKYLLALSAAALSAASANSQVLLAAWEFSNVAGDFSGNTVSANVSDLFAGDGSAFDSASGTLYANGMFGSTDVDNSGALTFNRTASNSSFNLDVDTTSRPLSSDLGNNVDGGGAASFTISDGSFGLGGASDASGASIVFAAFAPSGSTFAAGEYAFSYAAGNSASTGDVISIATSLDGTSYTSAGSDTVSTGDELGESISITALGGETGLFVRFTMPTLGFGSILLDNVQFTGSDAFVSAVPEPETYASLVGIFALGFMMVRRRRLRKNA